MTPTPTPLVDYAAWQSAVTQPWLMPALGVAVAVAVLLGAVSTLVRSIGVGASSDSESD